MPNIKSAKKRVRSNERKADVNTLVTSSMRTAVKNCEKAIIAGKGEEAKKTLNIAIQRVDKACTHGSVHKNKAARLKSRLTKAVNKMEVKKHNYYASFFSNSLKYLSIASLTGGNL